MEIDVRRVAELAKVRLSPDEMEAMKRDLESIVQRFERLSEIDVEGVEPTFGPHSENGVRLDEDVARPGLGRHHVLGLAATARDGYYVVPKEGPSASEKADGDGADNRSGDAPPNRRR